MDVNAVVEERVVDAMNGRAGTDAAPIESDDVEAGGGDRKCEAKRSIRACELVDHGHAGAAGIDEDRAQSRLGAGCRRAKKRDRDRVSVR